MDDPSDTAAKQRATIASPHARYEEDLYSWAIEQAALLRAGRVAEADARNIAEELDDVGNEQYDKLEALFVSILMHLLKWDHQPRRSRSWHLEYSGAAQACLEGLAQRSRSQTACPRSDR